MVRIDYTADDLKNLGKGSIVTTPDELVVAIKVNDRRWNVSGHAISVPDKWMKSFSNDWSNVRTILK